MPRADCLLSNLRLVRQPRPLGYIRSDVTHITLHLHEYLLACMDGGECAMSEVLSGIDSSLIVPEGDFPWQQTSRIATDQIPISTTLRAPPHGTIGLRHGCLDSTQAQYRW